jgi:hypothetical protein
MRYRMAIALLALVAALVISTCIWGGRVHRSAHLRNRGCEIAMLSRWGGSGVTSP